MNGLVLKLGPGERILINGAVIENGDRRTRLTLMTPNAHVLRLRDAIHPDEANTPVRRVCYIAQLAVAGEATPEEARRQLLSGIDQLSAVFDDAESVEMLDSAASHVVNARFYPALRALRGLLPREALLIAASQGGAALIAAQGAAEPD
ncbi:MAG: flagellar biosynthesis repressor FlbT [Alphaproteobacteria bacterium HGW-Alphaproteobacteria-8]|jgi:flagellar protein FlbT|nr:MAG: flagellar biosynthesis repressor FlbT [Alphaproteobacteria bacterium HGW-Alphaproteobacteria-8]